MENKILICSVNEFDHLQKITIIRGEQITTIGWEDIFSLGQRIADICYAYDINKVHMLGNEQYLAQQVVPKIHECAASQYNKTDIKVSFN